jgi:uncharacterized protein
VTEHGAPSPAIDAWWSYTRAPEYDVVGTTIDVTVRDGITIACELRRPARDGVPVDGRFPALVVEFSPYAVLRDFYLGEADFFVRRGYVAVVPLMRGIGRSGGAWDHGSFRQGGRDAHDVIEWLSTQPYSNGRIGMFGESFGGQASYSAALERPEHLLAIAPMQSPSSLYFDVIFPGGIKTTERGDIDNWPDIANLTSEGVIDADAEFAANRAHPTFDDFWRDRAFVDVLDVITIPVLAIGGWTDMYFRSGTLANIEALRDRTWAIYGPWNHYFPVAITEEPVVIAEHEHAPDMTGAPQMRPGVLLAWFDHWIGEVDGAPIPPAPTFTSYEGPLGGGTGWVDLDAWDPADRDGVTLHLGADGALTSEPGDDGTVTLRQAGDERDAITCTTEPLSVDQVLLGHPGLAFSAELDADDAHFTVELLDVDAEGNETLVNDGFLKASHRESHTDPTLVPIGETVGYRVPIRPQHHRFVTGHRVRVRLGGGSPTKLTAPPGPVTITLQTGASATLRLPGFTVPS